MHTSALSSARRARALFVFMSMSVLMGVYPLGVTAQMSSANYHIPWDTMSSGGEESGVSENYGLIDTIGGQALGNGSSASYGMASGYRAGDERPLGFEIHMAEAEATTYEYSNVSFSGKTVLLESAIAAASFVPGDWIALLQNPGLTQYVAIGKVASVSGATVTVDRFDGATASMSASPTAGTALVVELATNAVSFGLVTVESGAVSAGAVSVVANTSGYTLYIQANGAPTSGSDTISGVIDGAVTAGSEEYGVAVVGTTAAFSVDKVVTTDARALQTNTTATKMPADRVGILYKLAVASSTPTGTYAQSIFFTLTPHY